MTLKQQFFTALWIGSILGLGFLIPDIIVGRFDRADISVPLVSVFASFMTLNYVSRKN